MNKSINLQQILINLIAPFINKQYTIIKENQYMKLVLIRHGQSLWNKENIFTGWTDIDLSQQGEDEARSAGELLKNRNYDFDLCYTSYLKRSIKTMNIILEELDRCWLPVKKCWELNERHYGALQGKNKAEVAKEFGAEQVQIWRRSFGVNPPMLSDGDDRNPAKQEMYRDIDKKLLPLGESLETTIDRVIPFFEKEIKPNILSGKRVVIAAHGNSLRALLKYVEDISDEDIVNLDIPTGVPYVIEFDDDFKVKDSYYLIDKK
jgi:2,3-bisphosphoglycerate-dependent phosphoglycerate mutase